MVWAINMENDGNSNSWARYFCILNFQASLGVLPGNDISRVWYLEDGLIERLSWSNPWFVTRPRDRRVMVSFLLSLRILSTIDSMTDSTLAITQPLFLSVSCLDPRRRIFYINCERQGHLWTCLVPGTRCSNGAGWIKIWSIGIRVAVSAGG